MSYVVLARKYRPQSFSDVYSQEHIVRIFKNAIESDRLGQAYLFTGSRGVGKTSVARILAKSINCEQALSISPCNKCANCLDITQSVSPDVIEIDGASNTGVDDVRLLQKELLYATSQSRYKIIIIDEVHMLSKNAFNALLKTLEEPPDKVLFIFATTEPHKVLPTIISRCQRFDFKKIPVDMIVKRLKEISQIEKVNIEEEALYLIAKKADGGMRDALSLMDQVISYGLELITSKDVHQIFGLIDFDVYNAFMSSIANKNPSEVIQLFLKMSDNGIDIQEFINNYLEYLRQFLFVKLGIVPAEISKALLAAMQELVKDFTEDEIIYILNYLIEAKNNLRTSASPEVLAELTFIKLAKISEMKSLKAILDTIATNKLTYSEIPAPKAAESAVIEQSFPPTPISDDKNTVEKEQLYSNLTEDILTLHWDKLISQIKEEYPVSANYFSAAKLKNIHNNHIYFILSSEVAYKKLTLEKDKHEDIFSKHFHMRVLLSFEYVQEAAPKPTKNVTFEEIQKESPALAKFIELTDSRIRQD